MLTAATAISLPAQEVLAIRDLDSWARFPTGSWKLVRTVTETIDPAGQSLAHAVVYTKTTVSQVAANKLTLKIDVTTVHNGQWINANPQQIQQGFCGENATQQAVFQTVGKTKIAIEGKEYPCEIREISLTKQDQTTVTKQYVSATHSPYVLKSETVTTETADVSPQYRTVSEVYALDMPCKVGSDIKTGAHERLVQQTPEETVISLDVNVPEIPGGIISRTTKELDAAGNVVRRSTLELVSYQVAIDSDPKNEQRRRRLFGRERIRR